MIKIKYRLICYEDYKKIIEKYRNEILLDGNMNFDDAINYIVSLYNKKYLKNGVYVEELDDKTWPKFLNDKFIFENLNAISYKFIHHDNSLKYFDKNFHLFENEISIVIDLPPMGGCVDSKEGIDYIIHSDEKDKHMNNPHVHAKYSGEELFIYIKDGSVKDNKMFKSRSKTRKAIDYVKSHKEELLVCWNKITDSNLNIDFLMTI